MSSTVVQVALGGAAGSVLRYLTGLAALQVLGPAFPWGTLCVNVLGSFLMGLSAVVLLARDAQVLSPLLMTGVLGGFTTFSAFSLDVAVLAERGEAALAGLYIAASIALSLAALTAGLWLARGWV